MAEKLREILEHYLFTNPNPRIKDINQATAEIKSLLKSKLPKKIITVDKKSDYDRVQGYDLALTEIEKIAEEL